MKDPQNRKDVHERPDYIIVKTAACSGLAAAVSWMASGSDSAFVITKKVCDSATDLIAEPIDRYIHGPRKNTP